MPSAEHEHVVETISPKVRPAHLSFEERQSGFAEAAATLFPKLAKDVRYESVDAGGVAAEWVVVPESDDGRVVFYLHGGGYTQGSPETHRELVSRVARHARARVLCIDYRLAPAHPFPAAVEDALTAYNWLMDSGVSASSVAFAGDSAGGGLAVADAAGLARPAPARCPRAWPVLSPWFDLEGAGQSALADDDPIVQRQHLLDVAGVYLAGADPRHPHASPVHGRFESLPPILLQVGTRDLLLDDLRGGWKAAARAAGVDVDPRGVARADSRLAHLGRRRSLRREPLWESVGRFIRGHAEAHGPSTVALSLEAVAQEARHWAIQHSSRRSSYRKAPFEASSSMDGDLAASWATRPPISFSVKAQASILASTPRAASLATDAAFTGSPTSDAIPPRVWSHHAWRSSSSTLTRKSTGQVLDTELVEFIRPELTFADIATLIEQIRLDVEVAKSILGLAALATSPKSADLGVHCSLVAVD